MRRKRQHPQHCRNAFANIAAGLAHRAAPHGAGTGKVVINLAAHDRCFTDDRIGQVRCLGSGRVHHHRQRGLERMGQVDDGGDQGQTLR